MSTSFARLRPFRVAGFAIGSVAVAGAAIFISASAAGVNLGVHNPFAAPPAAGRANPTSANSAATSAACTDFIAHLAGDLGVSQSQVEAAIQKATAQTIADQVSANKLTQAQASAISQQLSKRPICSLPSSLGKRPGTAAAAYLRYIETATASVLGLTPAQLRSDLAGGKSLSQLAAAHNPPLSESDFRAQLIAKLKPELDAAVAGGQLSQAQETAILNRLQTAPIPFWNRPPAHPSAKPTSSPAA